MKNKKNKKKIIYFFGKNFLKYIYNYIQKKSRAPKFWRRGTSALNEKKSHNSREMRNLNILISNTPNVGGFLRDGIDIEQFNIQFQSFINWLQLNWALVLHAIQHLEL